MILDTAVTLSNSNIYDVKYPERKDTINVTRSDLPPLEEYVDYLQKIWASRWLTNNGELLQTFEKGLASYLNVNSIIAVNNGTIGLEVTLKALELKGEVITTPFTFAATTNVILWEGLVPVFADIDPNTYNIDPEDVERKITDKTCAILAVHVYGNPCYVKKLEAIADKYGLKLIYDAAHAFGVEYQGQSILNYGDISVLSFHATKVFNTIEGGAIVSRDCDLHEKIRLLINHGIQSEEEVIIPGTNGKMNEFQAAMGLCNLRRIDKNIKSRETLYNYYKEELKGTGKCKFQDIIASKYNYAYMPVCFANKKERDSIYNKLADNGFKSRKYFYPITVNFDYYKNSDLIKKYSLNNASSISDRILCLPLYPELSVEDVEKIANIVKDTVVTHSWC